MADVELNSVAKSFGKVPVCRGVDLRIADGEFVTLLGPSGCGKTTTLNLIAGLEDASAGDILIGGRRVNHLTPFERDVAMVFQNYALYPHMTVAENIGFTLRLRRLPRDEIRRRVSALADSLELGPVLDRLPAQLSGGQQQRVALGRAIIREPQVFLFDEPFSNLDSGLRIKLRAEIKELHQRLRVTSIFVTHDQEEALSLSDRIAVMREGRVEQYGTPAEVYARPVSRYVARFIGSPPMDFLPGEIAVEDGRPVFRIGAIAVPLEPELADALGGTTGPCELGVRPEHVVLGNAGAPANVRLVQPVGASTFVTVAWDGGSLIARVPGMASFSPGERVHFSMAPRHVMLFDAAGGRRVSIPGEAGVINPSPGSTRRVP
jgi:multiple sugar transport system ATP-binding protein